MLAFILAAAITLPPNAVGMWGGDAGFVEFGADGFLYAVQVEEQLLQVDCRFTDQIEGMFGYSFECTDGHTGMMQFLDSGDMLIDGYRFTAGGSHDGD